ncbi:MAG TPA: glycosyl hydrolase family 28-related protein [Bryobacteraceae bacterium]|jgi:hypothetical protein|nr:glycosyl hydrolase family 28-related protein [Bryobacteraceae bacterium]
MKKLSLLFLAGSLLAQSTAVFPGRVATNSDLKIASNNYASTLSLGVNSTSTTLTVPSTSGFVAPGVITIDSEVIAVCAVASGTAFTVGSSACPNADGRGYDGTAAASHLASRAVQGRVTAGLHNQMAAETSAIETKLHNELPSIVDYGADPTGTNDSTTAIQTALDASTGGKSLFCPVGTYKITAGLTLPAYVHFYGPPTDLQQGSSLDGGCMLKWAGSAPSVAYATGSAMVNVHAVNGTKVDGISLDGANTANLTGYMIDAESGATAQRNTFRNGLIEHFGDSTMDIAGAAISLGDNDIVSDEQVDGVTISDFNVTDADIGVRMKNANIAYTKFDHFSIAGINRAFSIEYAGYYEISQGTAGVMQGTNPCVVCFDGPHGNPVIQSIQAENDSSITMNAKFFEFTANAVDDNRPITLISNIVGWDSDVTSNQHIISIANQWINCHVNLTGDSVVVASLVDQPSDPSVKTGGNSNWVVLSPSYSGTDLLTFTNNINVEGSAVVNFAQDPHSTSVTDARNKYTDITGQLWANSWSATKFCQRDVTGSDFPFLCGDAGLSGNDGFLIHHGYNDTSALRFMESASTSPLPANSLGWWVQSGIGAWYSALSPTNMIGLTSSCMAVGPNTSPVAFPIGGVCTMYVRNEDDSGPTRVIVQASATAQSTSNLASFEDAAGNARTYVKSDGHLGLGGLAAFANNAAAISGGLVAGDIYVVTGSDPLQLALVN